MFHRDLAQGKWFSLPLSEQLGHAGSEIARALSWRRRGNNQAAEMAQQRFFELLDLTIADQRWRKRLKEMLRVREMTIDFFYGQNEYQTKPEDLLRYFDCFAWAARRNK